LQCGWILLPGDRGWSGYQRKSKQAEQAKGRYQK